MPFIDGLLSHTGAQNRWQLAEQASLARPYRTQSLLGRGSWSAGVLRDKIREGSDLGPWRTEWRAADDETGFLKKGSHSVGVVRQYSAGTAGRIENCRLGVFLAYANRLGQIDRCLYLAEAWAADDARRREAHVPEKVAFATNLQIAGELVGAAGCRRAVRLGVGRRVVRVDSKLRRLLEYRRQAYVLAVRSNLHLRFVTRKGFIQTDPATLADELTPDTWKAHPR